MGTIRKRGRRYYAEVCLNGKRKGKSHSTHKQARDWVRQAEVGVISLVPGKVTLSDLVERYIREVSKHHKGAHQEKFRLRRLVKELPAGPVAKITSSQLSEWKNEKIGQVSPATVRRYMTALSSVLNYALTELAGDRSKPANRR